MTTCLTTLGFLFRVGFLLILMLIDYSCPVVFPPDPLRTLFVLYKGRVNLFININLFVIALKGTIKVIENIFTIFLL